MNLSKTCQKQKNVKNRKKNIEEKAQTTLKTTTTNKP